MSAATAKDLARFERPVRIAGSLIEGEGFESLRQEIETLLRASTSNRLLFELGGRLGHRFLLRQAARRGPRTFLADWYRFGATKAAIYPLARLWWRRRFSDPSVPNQKLI